MRSEKRKSTDDLRDQQRAKDIERQQRWNQMRMEQEMAEEQKRLKAIEEHKAQLLKQQAEIKEKEKQKQAELQKKAEEEAAKKAEQTKQSSNKPDQSVPVKKAEEVDIFADKIKTRNELLTAFARDQDSVKADLQPDVVKAVTDTKVKALNRAKTTVVTFQESKSGSRPMFFDTTSRNKFRLKELNSKLNKTSGKNVSHLVKEFNVKTSMLTFTAEGKITAIVEEAKKDDSKTLLTKIEDYFTKESIFCNKLENDVSKANWNQMTEIAEILNVHIKKRKEKYENIKTMKTKFKEVAFEFIKQTNALEKPGAKINLDFNNLHPDLAKILAELTKSKTKVGETKSENEPIRPSALLQPINYSNIHDQTDKFQQIIDKK